MLSLVITIIVILILAAIAFASSTKVIDEADYSNYVNNLSEVSTFFEKTSVNMHNSDFAKEITLRNEQIYNFVAKGGKTEEDILFLRALPAYTIIKDEADIGMELPLLKVESGTGYVIPIKYATTKHGQIFTWPPYDYKEKYYITDMENVNNKMQSEITVGDETFTIVIDPIDGSLMDAPIIEIPNISSGETNVPSVEEPTPEIPKEDILEHTHDFSSKTATDLYLSTRATCKTLATYYYKCTGCAEKGTATYTYGSLIPHSYGEYVIEQNANCSQLGRKVRTCSVCGFKETITLEKDLSKHDEIVTRVAILASCTTTGKKEFYCEACEKVVSIDSIPVTGHTYKSEVTKQATCTQAGVKTYACTICFDSYTENLEMLEHSIVSKEAVSPTCTNEGLTSGSVCSKCDKVFNKQDVIPALGHTEIYAGMVDVHTKCSKCQSTLSTIHTYTNKIETIATCNNVGIERYTCDCGYSYTLEIPKTKHEINLEKLVCENCNQNFVMYFFSPSSYDNLTNEKTLTSESVHIPFVFEAKGKLYFTVSTGMDCYRNFNTVKEVTIEDGVLQIQQAGFYECTSIEKITIPKSVTYIGGLVFYGATALKEVIFENGNIMTSIGPQTFESCISLTSVELPTTITTLGGNAFYDCSSLNSISLGESLVTIDDAAFWGCAALPEITLPNTLTTLGNRVFNKCSSLYRINFSGTMAEWNAIEKDSNWYGGTPPFAIYCSDGVIGKYENDTVSGVSAGSATYKIIGEKAFKNCTGLNDVTLPKTLEEIGSEAFYGCTALKKITYRGTIEEWNAIIKGANWATNSSLTTIVCSDGTITL